MCITVHEGRRRIIVHTVESIFIVDYQQFRDRPVQHLVQRWTLEDFQESFVEIGGFEEVPAANMSSFSTIFELYKGLTEKMLAKPSEIVSAEILERRMVRASRQAISADNQRKREEIEHLRLGAQEAQQQAGS